MVGNGYDATISTAGLDDLSGEEEDGLDNEYGGWRKSKKWTASSSGSSLSEYGKVFDLDLLKKKKNEATQGTNQVISGKSGSGRRQVFKRC